MSAANEGPHRGDDVWRAQKQAIAERNEAAYAAGRVRRATRDQEAAKRLHAQEKKANANPPKQPGR